MKRISFLKLLALLPATATAMKISDLEKITGDMPNTPKMPVLFLGHGSPMNAIEENEFVQGFRKVSSEIARPTAILCISAHWETRGTRVTAMPHPRTIHDFGGFPQALFDVQYPAPGSPALARETQAFVTKTDIHLDDHWGLDHGAWSVIKHLYPDADVPVIQLSLDRTKDAAYHYDLARQLEPLRHKGVLIVASGNMVHNLGMVAWDRLNASFGLDWALEASTLMKQYMHEGNHQALIDYERQGKAFQLSIPTPEHYLPLLYTLALQQEKEEIHLFNDQHVAGAIAMLSVKIG